MTIYNTFAECLKNHPEEKVMTTGKNWSGDYEIKGKFAPMKQPDGGHCGISGERHWVEANPADHLMTLEAFLAAGCLVKAKDKILNNEGKIQTVNYASDWNEKDESDREYLILSAACFGGGSHPVESKAMEVNVEEIDFSKAPEGATHYLPEIGSFYKKESGTWFIWHADMEVYQSCLNGGAWHKQFLKPIPRMRTDYVRVEFSEDNEHLKRMIDGEVFYTHDGEIEYSFSDGRFSSRYEGCKHGAISWTGGSAKLYKKVQTPIDERQESIDEMYRDAQLAECVNFTKGMAAALYDAGYRKPE